MNGILFPYTARVPSGAPEAVHPTMHVREMCGSIGVVVQLCSTRLRSVPGHHLDIAFLLWFETCPLHSCSLRVIRLVH